MSKSRAALALLEKFFGPMSREVDAVKRIQRPPINAPASGASDEQFREYLRTLLSPNNLFGPLSNTTDSIRKLRKYRRPEMLIPGPMLFGDSEEDR